MVAVDFDEGEIEEQNRVVCNALFVIGLKKLTFLLLSTAHWAGRVLMCFENVFAFTKLLFSTYFFTIWFYRIDFPGQWTVGFLTLAGKKSFNCVFWHAFRSKVRIDTWAIQLDRVTLLFSPRVSIKRLTRKSSLSTALRMFSFEFVKNRPRILIWYHWMKSQKRLTELQRSPVFYCYQPKFV